MKNQTRQVIILRGLPGSGKSTIAESLWRNMYAQVVSVDHHMYNDEGEYEFDMRKLGDCCAECKREFKEHITNDITTIVVDNVFSKTWEFKWYMAYAKKHGYTVTTLIVENYHNGTPQYTVPEDVLTTMKTNFEMNL